MNKQQITLLKLLDKQQAENTILMLMIMAYVVNNQITANEAIFISKHYGVTQVRTQ